MGLRHLGRELALKVLYQLDICASSDWRESLRELSANFWPYHSHALGFAKTLVEGVIEHRELLDQHLQQTIDNWMLNRLSRIDHNILRLALYELIALDDIPARVTIDEAIEIAKAYGDADSGRFVNGVLDRLAERLGLRNKGESDAMPKTE